MHYLSKSSRADWKVSRRDYLERKRSSRRRSAMGQIHLGDGFHSQGHKKRLPAVVQAKSAKRRLLRRLRQISLRDMLTVLILLETILWISYGIICRIRQVSPPAAIHTGAWILGVILAAAFAVFCSRPGMRRIRRRRRLLYLEYAAIVMVMVFHLWRRPVQAGAAAFLPALVWGIDRISAFLG